MNAPKPEANARRAICEAGAIVQELWLAAAPESLERAALSASIVALADAEYHLVLARRFADEKRAVSS